jgi:hypothetical protein
MQNPPILRGGLENADLLLSQVWPRIMVFSYSKKIL